MDNRFDHLGEIWAERGLAIATEGNLLEVEQLFGDTFVTWEFAHFSGEGTSQHFFEFFGQHLRVDTLICLYLAIGARSPINLAIGAIEVTELIGVEIHAKGQTGGTLRNNSVDKAVSEKASGAP